MPAKPKAIVFEYYWGDNKIDANGNVIPDSDVTYFVCEPLWIEDEDPTEVGGILIDQSCWEADLDKVLGEFDTEKEANEFLLKIGAK
tara:strand:+ start:898 stop:1158 length:261 start_codon:yes stop_codon:yes gene_type:complete